MPAKEGVVKLVPVPKEVPPVRELYQFTVPTLATAVKVTVPASHRLAGVVEVMVGMAFITAITTVLVGVVHPFAVAST